MWQLLLAAFCQRFSQKYCSVNTAGNLSLDHHHHRHQSSKPPGHHQLKAWKSKLLLPRSLQLKGKLQEGHLRWIFLSLYPVKPGFHYPSWWPSLFCCSRFNVCLSDIACINKSFVWARRRSQLTAQCLSIVSLLLELLFVRLGYLSLLLELLFVRLGYFSVPCFTRDEVDCAIHALCTSWFYLIFLIFNLYFFSIWLYLCVCVNYCTLCTISIIIIIIIVFYVFDRRTQAATRLLEPANELQLLSLSSQRRNCSLARRLIHYIHYHTLPCLFWNLMQLHVLKV